MKDKEQLLKEYLELSQKLGKLATKREVRKFLCSEDKVKARFGSLTNLKKEAAAKDPSLLPQEITDDDILEYKLKIAKSSQKKNEQITVSGSTALELVERFSEKVFGGRLAPYSPPKSKADIKRALILTLSDLHFGSDTNKSETGFESYGQLEEARRLAAVIQQTIEYKRHYRKSTVLHVNLLGDIIQHKLHDPQDAAPMAEQICRAIHLLTQALARLAQDFPEVIVHCSTGNHGRDLARHNGRATSGKWDSVETVIYYSIKNALKNYTNLKINIPKTPFVMYSVLGHRVFATHGDNVINPGNPGKSINVGKLESQINRMNASLEDKEEIRLVFVGHTHSASVSYLTNGTAIITNGALCPVDPYAVSLGILEGRSSQTLMEVTPKHYLGDIRFIKVGAEQDHDLELDKLIKPWSGL